MTDLKQIDLPDNAPKWAIKAFEYDGDVVFGNKAGQVKKRNGHFIPGTSGNAKGISSDQAKAVVKIRSLAMDALHDWGLPKLVKHLKRKDLKTHELTAIVKLLMDMSLPKQTEAIETEDKNIPRIVITKEAFEEAMKQDKLYEQTRKASENEDIVLE